MINNEIMKKVVESIKMETVPALGCTELGAVAYATSVVKKYLEGQAIELDIKVSKEIYKNGKSVMIPYTNKRGLDLVGALGVVCGNPDDKLMVLKNVNSEYLNLAQSMVEEGKVHIDFLENTPVVYVKVFARDEQDNVEVILRDSHDHIDTIKVNGKIVYENIFKVDNEVAKIFEDLTLRDIRYISENIPLEDIKFIEQGVNMNKKAANVGIRDKNGLQIGSTLTKLNEEGKLSIGVPMKARILTAAAADTRMGGGSNPIMSSGGSGNQGIGVILPIAVVAEENNVDEETLIRAVFFAHCINKYVKIYTGKLSSMCGCAIGAAVGASAAISWMLGGNDKQISGACNNVLANLTGMICDGAKESCALKLSTSAEEAVIAAYLANENIIVSSKTGIIGQSIEDTIKNVGILCKDSIFQMECLN